MTVGTHFRSLSCVLLAFAAWFPTLCLGSHNDDTITNVGAGSYPPSPSPPHTHDDYPPSYGSNTQSSGGGDGSRWGAGAGSGIDFLVAAFFLIAAGWLVLALIYSILVLIVVRLRSRGQLDVYDENFGRFYLLGTRCYIPFGCVLRRYVIAMNQERDHNGDPVTVRLMTREERRLAMERLLDQDDVGGEKRQEPSETEEKSTAASNSEESPEESDKPEESTEATTDDNQVGDDASEEEVVCTICLNEYEPTDECFTSSVCSHQFHRACILEWLQRRANTECPCCRTPLVTDEQVWETVQEMREERRRQVRKANRGGCFSRFRRRGREQSTSSQQDEATVDPTPPPSPSPTTLSSFASGDEYAQNDSVVVEVAEATIQSASVSRPDDLESGRRLDYE